MSFISSPRHVTAASFVENHNGSVIITGPLRVFSEVKRLAALSPPRNIRPPVFKSVEWDPNTPDYQQAPPMDWHFVHEDGKVGFPDHVPVKIKNGIIGTPSALYSVLGYSLKKVDLSRYLGNVLVAADEAKRRKGQLYTRNLDVDNQTHFEMESGEILISASYGFGDHWHPEPRTIWTRVPDAMWANIYGYVFMYLEGTCPLYCVSREEVMLFFTGKIPALTARSNFYIKQPVLEDAPTETEKVLATRLCAATAGFPIRAEPGLMLDDRGKVVASRSMGMHWIYYPRPDTRSVAFTDLRGGTTTLNVSLNIEKLWPIVMHAMESNQVPDDYFAYCLWFLPPELRQVIYRYLGRPPGDPVLPRDRFPRVHRGPPIECTVKFAQDRVNGRIMFDGTKLPAKYHYMKVDERALNVQSLLAHEIMHGPLYDHGITSGVKSFALNVLLVPIGRQAWSKNHHGTTIKTGLEKKKTGGSKPPNFMINGAGAYCCNLDRRLYSEYAEVGGRRMREKYDRYHQGNTLAIYTTFPGQGLIFGDPPVPDLDDRYISETSTETEFSRAQELMHWE